ncbi:Inner membrane protein YghB [Cronobacter sakazakii]|nr:Inner membrane protein YghB [Cronobacter sakazakii]
MAVIQDIIAALWHHDFAALADPHIVGVVWCVMFATLFLEMVCCRRRFCRR